MQSINKRIYFVLLEHDETGQCICMNEKKTVKLNISLLVCAEVFEWSPTTLSGNVHNSVCICRSLSVLPLSAVLLLSATEGRGAEDSIQNPNMLNAGMLLKATTRGWTLYCMWF